VAPPSRARNTIAQIPYANEPVKGPTSHVVKVFQYLTLHVARLAVDDDVNAPSRVQVHRRRVV